MLCSRYVLLQPDFEDLLFGITGFSMCGQVKGFSEVIRCWSALVDDSRTLFSAENAASSLGLLRHYAGSGLSRATGFRGVQERADSNSRYEVEPAVSKGEREQIFLGLKRNPLRVQE